MEFNSGFKGLKTYCWAYVLQCLRDQSKVVAVHVMKAYGGSTDTAPLILNLRTGGEWSVRGSSTINIDDWNDT